eukprot:TRINITY_DN6847_c0_g1_i5.p2 TRINITY_DN6847_c0_g1~~TRINITY_DN6847_c0_g1_i5.p2  ORF type:complete len:244 (+),score=47.54 TRINITY_DN6847_c0_g1_i5:22-732(+)
MAAVRRLTVQLIRATDVPVADLFTSDPYIIFTLGATVHRSTVKPRTLNPEWNESFEFPVSDPEERLSFILYDNDTFRRDDELGRIDDISIATLPRNEATEMVLYPCRDQRTAVVLVLTASGFGVDLALVRFLLTQEELLRKELECEELRQINNLAWKVAAFGKVCAERELVWRDAANRGSEVLAYTVQRLCALIERDVALERAAAKALWNEEQRRKENEAWRRKFQRSEAWICSFP